MTRIVAHTLRRIKDDPHRIFDAGVVADLAGQLGVVWRDRVLTPAVTIRLFLLQVLHRDVACAALPHLSGLAFTAGAYCLAREIKGVRSHLLMPIAWVFKITTPDPFYDLTGEDVERPGPGTRGDARATRSADRRELRETVVLGSA